MFDPELVQEPPHRVVHKLLDRPGTGVEGRDGGDDYGSGSG